jgi:hypothetical protein
MTSLLERELLRKAGEDHDQLLADAADKIKQLKIKLAEMIKGGEELATALLLCQCSCPEEKPCDCERDQALNNWHWLRRFRKNDPIEQFAGTCNLPHE